MDRLTTLGLLAVTAMLVFYAFEKRSHWFILAFAGSCVLASAYGSSREPNHLVWWKRSGPALRHAAGGLSVSQSHNLGNGSLVAAMKSAIFITSSWLFYDFFRPFAVRFSCGSAEPNVIRN